MKQIVGLAKQARDRRYDFGEMIRSSVYLHDVIKGTETQKARSPKDNKPDFSFKNY